MPQDPVNNDQSTLVKWFVNDDKHQFQTYNSVMAGIATEKVVGDDAKTNFFTARWVSTMIAVEATAVVAFLTIQTAFMLVTRPLLQVLQLNFSKAGETFKDSAKVTLIAAKILVSMIPLIVYGMLSPKGAYEKIAKKLDENAQAKAAASLAAEKELNEVKDKLATSFGVEKKDFAKLTAQQIADRITALKTGHETTLRQIATAIGKDQADYDLAQLVNDVTLITQEKARLEGAAGGDVEVATKLQALDHALCTALGEDQRDLGDDRLIKLQVLVDSHERVAALDQQVADLTRAKDAAVANVAEHLATIQDLQKQIATAKVQPDAGELEQMRKELAAKRLELEQAGAKLARLETAERELTQANDQARLAEEFRAVWEGKHTAMKAAHDALQLEVEELKGKLQRAEAAAKPIDGGEETVPKAQLTALEEQLAQVRRDALAAQQEAERVTRELEQAKEKVETELARTKATLVRAESDLNDTAAARLRETEENEEALRGLRAEVQTLTKEHAEAIARAREEAVAEFKATLPDTHVLKATYDDLVAEKEQLALQLAEVSGRLEALDGSQQQIEALTSAKQQLETKKAELEQRLQINSLALEAANRIKEQALEQARRANAMQLELSRSIHHYVSPDLADPQCLAHPKLYNRPEAVLDLFFNMAFTVGAQRDQGLGTSLTYQLLAEQHRLNDYIKAAHETAQLEDVDAGVREMYTDFANKIQEGRLAPIPTGIAQANTTEDGIPWKDGETTAFALCLSVVKRVADGDEAQEAKDVKMMVFAKRDGDDNTLYLPLSARTKEEEKALKEVYKGAPFLSGFSLADGHRVPEMEHVNCDLTEWTTDVTWVGQDTAIHRIEEGRLGELAGKLGAGWNLVLVPQDEYDEQNLAGLLPNGYDKAAVKASYASTKAVVSI